MPERLLRIGLDFDDVLVNSAEYTARRYNEDHGTALTRDHWYDFRSMEPWGVSALPEAVERVQTIMHADTFTGLEPIAEARPTLQRLKRLGHLFFVVTGRPSTIALQTARTIEALYPDELDPSELYFTDHFGYAGARRTKASVAAELGLTHFVDDQVEHANGMGPIGVQAVLFSDHYSWNQTGANPDVITLGSWPEIGDYLDEQSHAAVS